MLGGTAWLGRELSRAALEAGHHVTCLARGESGPVAPGARLDVGDRSAGAAYQGLGNQSWDSVIDVSWQPAFVREALASLAGAAGHWIYVSSGSVYADTTTVGADESAEVVPASAADGADPGEYGGAKVACEMAVREALPERCLIVRPGLIGGPGDTSGRSGYWPARAARDLQGPMLVPDAPDLPTQVVDVRDLADWIIRCAESRTTGIFNAVGPVVPFAEWVRICRAVARHRGPVVLADPAWLLEQGVAEYMGADSLAMWIADPGWVGFSSRSDAAALSAGLAHRPRRQLVQDVLKWEREQGLERTREAGLGAEREGQLLALLSTQPSSINQGDNRN